MPLQYMFPLSTPARVREAALGDAGDGYGAQ